MTVSLTSLQKLMSLRLSTEQMEGVIAVLAEELKPLEAIRKANAERQRNVRASRDCHVTAATDSSVMPRDTRVLDNIITISQEVSKKESITSDSFPQDPPGFKDFWAIYPPRAGDRDRKPATKAFAAALKRVDLKTLLAGTERYAADCKAKGKINTEYVKQARTWLNADGWNETYEVSPSSDFSSARDFLQRIGRA